MHVLHCLTHSVPGGAQEVVRLLVSTFAERFPAVRQTVVLPPDGPYVGRFRNAGIDVVTSPMNALSPAAFAHTRRALTALAPTLVHSHGKGAGLHCRSISRTSLGARRVHSFHGFHPPLSPFGREAYVRLERALARRTDAFILVSTSEAEEVRAVVRPGRVRMETIGNTVDAHDVLQRASMGPGTQVETFIRGRDSRPRVCMVGRDDAVKDYPLGLDALARVLERNAGVDAILVGPEPTSPAMRAFASAWSGRVLVVGTVPDAVPILSRCRLLLMTSIKEGSPLAILEAQALGLPVVGTAVPGVRDVVDNGTTGILTTRDAGSIADAVVALVEGPEVWERLSAGAQAAGRRRSVRAWAERYHAVYESLA